MLLSFYAPVAQPDRVTDYELEGRVFFRSIGMYVKYRYVSESQINQGFPQENNSS